MTEIGACLEQIRRLRVYNYFATLDEGSLAELARMLTWAHDEAVAKAVIDQWLEEQTERPTPADLRRLVALHNEAREPAPEPEPVYGCAGCEDTGLVGGILGPGGVPWSRCRCAKGAAFPEAKLDEMNAVWRRLQVNTETQRVQRIGHIRAKPLTSVGDIYRDV
jgi:hypothetical protein